MEYYSNLKVRLPPERNRFDPEVIHPFHASFWAKWCLWIFETVDLDIVPILKHTARSLKPALFKSITCVLSKSSVLGRPHLQTLMLRIAVCFFTAIAVLFLSLISAASSWATEARIVNDICATGLDKSSHISRPCLIMLLPLNWFQGIQAIVWNYSSFKTRRWTYTFKKNSMIFLAMPITNTL